MRVFLLFVGLSLPLAATSVGIISKTCPVCGGKSAAFAVLSYSNFGGPRLDLSDQPMFLSANTSICPYDGYASLESAWDIENADEKQRLRTFLENPHVSLSPAESEIIGDKLRDLRKHSVWRILWARSCDRQRAPNPRREWMRAMMLLYSTAGQETPMETALHQLFREEAIKATRRATGEDWPEEDERNLIFPYLLAELDRQAGRVEEAKLVFRKFAAIKPDGEEGAKSLIQHLSEIQLKPPKAPAPGSAEIPPLDLPDEREPNPAADKLRDEFKGLDEKLDAADAKTRGEVARDFAAKIREKDADAQTAGYPINSLLPRLASLKPGISPALAKETGGEWRSDFWKSAVAWLAGEDGAAQRLAAHPVVEQYFPDHGKVYEALLWECFRKAKDPVWVEKAIARLAEKRNIYHGELEYALALDDPRLAVPIQERHKWLLSQDWNGGWERQSLGHEAGDIESQLIDRFLQRLPVKQ